MLFLILTTCLLGVTQSIILPSPCYMTPTAGQSSANRTLGDGGYKILFDNPTDEYVPNRLYTITLQGSATSDGLKLINHFSLKQHLKKHIPDIMFSQVFGSFEIDYETLSTFDIICTMPKVHLMFERRVLWRAPSAGAGCVVFTAMILENSERWYAEDGALTKTICEAKTELDNVRKTRKLEVAENTEDESKRLHVKLIQKRYITLLEDPVLKAICTARPSPGPCEGYYRRWAFDPQKLKCEPFVYGGCQGNQNNFLSEKICDKACDIVRTALIRQALNVTVNRDRTPNDPRSSSSSSSSSPYSAGVSSVSQAKSIQKRHISLSDNPVHEENIKAVCMATPSPGPCSAYIRRWAFNPQILKCESFVYGGCEGNQNNFRTKRVCERACISVRQI